MLEAVHARTADADAGLVSPERRPPDTPTFSRYLSDCSPSAWARIASDDAMVHTFDPGALALCPEVGSTMPKLPKSPPKRRANAVATLALAGGAEADRRPAALEVDDDALDDLEGELEFDERGPAEREQARRGLQQRLGAYLSAGRPRLVITDNVHTMVSIKRGDGVVTFRLHHMFLEAPSVVLRALGRYAEGQDRQSARLLRDFIDANDHRVRRRDGERPITCDVEGKYHNLLEIFDELNEHYFDGTIVARITWGPRNKRKRSRDSIKLGSYTFEDELIRIHPVLDAADVPRFFVAWIVYHEMLHEVHDMPIVDGRRVYHTPEFRRAEAQFDQYAEAVLWERTNLHRLLER